jgi:hypothetical protein
LRARHTQRKQQAKHGWSVDATAPLDAHSAQTGSLNPAGDMCLTVCGGAAEHYGRKHTAHEERNTTRTQMSLNALRWAWATCKLDPPAALAGNCVWAALVGYSCEVSSSCRYQDGNDGHGSASGCYVFERNPEWHKTPVPNFPRQIYNKNSEIVISSVFVTT